MYFLPRWKMYYLKNLAEFWLRLRCPQKGDVHQPKLAANNFNVFFQVFHLCQFFAPPREIERNYATIGIVPELHRSCTKLKLRRLYECVSRRLHVNVFTASWRLHHRKSPLYLYLASNYSSQSWLVCSWCV